MIITQLNYICSKDIGTPYSLLPQKISKEMELPWGRVDILYQKLTREYSNKTNKYIFHNL